MNEPVPYRWMFDRNHWDSREGANTFSVGIYQWVPKLSGRGFKKSKTIRVLGYVKNARAAYAKAEEICDSLNRERASIEKPPGWLQKTYSLPKPEGFSIRLLSTELSSERVRTLRRQVMRERLLPIGFVQSHASTYIRRRGELVQLINFQTMTWGGSFTVNLGLHYTFTPPLNRRRRIKWTSLDFNDCILEGRLGFFLPRKLDMWFKFGDDEEKTRKTLKECADRSVEALDRYAEKLADPGVMLLEDRNFLRPFRLAYPTALEGSVEIRMGRLDDAEARLRMPLPADHQVSRALHRLLLDEILKLRKASSDAVAKARLIEWCVGSAGPTLSEIRRVRKELKTRKVKISRREVRRWIEHGRR